MPPRLRALVVVLLTMAPVLAAVGPAGGASSSAAPPRVEERAATYTVTGRVVRLGNGRPIRGVRVQTTDPSGSDVTGSDLTDGQGRFVVRDVQAEDSEFGIYVRGARVGYRNGWVGCDRTLKPTFGAACTHGTTLGRIRIRAR